jgi:hypothetical protein
MLRASEDSRGGTGESSSRRLRGEIGKRKDREGELRHSRWEEEGERGTLERMSNLRERDWVQERVREVSFERLGVLLFAGRERRGASSGRVFQPRG